MMQFNEREIGGYLVFNCRKFLECYLCYVVWSNRFFLMSGIQNDRIFSDLGPCVRDYIHVLDLADGHIVVLRKLDDPKIDFPLENAYELLGVSETNSFDEIKASFRKLAKETHQDLAESMNDSTASRQFVKILADYEVCANLVLEDLSSH
ncbi:hypothetical protein D0Y65_019109 [Glycine soja]|uniref:J domain-containing protein n=1 Tax=Glycine soja TaxID=3848 RepID=A0A445K2A4_GLYSO|nr:hypothetical protein D0Y65_019109 [Glycine soja]RZC04861.1 hypothetical protein D0Y65_019109 [Glycine soja]